MDNFLLALVRSFKWLYKINGVDFTQLLAIVAVKLKSDNRRQHISYRNNSGKEASHAFLITLLIYTVLGAVMGLFLSMNQSLMFSMTLFFSYLIVMIAMTLITDFSAVLLDTSDNTIILPRPVSGKTLFAARLTHIMLYLGQLGIGLTIVPAMVVASRYGLLLLAAFLILVILSIMAAVFITNVAYLLIIQFSSEDQLKNIINYLQIGMAIIFMGGYQLLPHAMAAYNLDSGRYDTAWWSYLLPPVWMAATLEMFVLRQPDAGHLAMAICAVLVPVSGLLIVNKFLTPVFSQKLGVIGPASSTSRPASQSGTTILKNLARFITQSSHERAAFFLVYKTLARDRKIKLKIYPTIGYLAIFVIMLGIREQSSVSSFKEHLATSQYHLMLLYLPLFVLQVAFHEIAYSDDFKAGWVYHSAPVGRPGELLSGMIKALFVRFFLIPYFFLSLIVIAIMGPTSILDVVVAGINNYLMLMILAMIADHSLPLSLAPAVRTQSGTMARGLIAVVVIGIITAAHYFTLLFKPALLFAFFPIQIVAGYLLTRAYRAIAWSEITP
jgi:hypothetical protein